MIYRATWSRREAEQGRHSIEVEAPHLRAVKRLLRSCHHGSLLPALYVLPCPGERRRDRDGVLRPVRYHRVVLKEDS